MRAVFQFVLAATLAVLPHAAHSTVCSLNIERAYQAAKAAGWRFQCDKGVVTFDNQKRVGCTVKTGAAFKVTNKGYMFGYGQPVFDGGWRLHSYKVSGGVHQQLTWDGIFPIVFRFDVSGPNRTGRRYISELKLQKPLGDCSKVYSEAFKKPGS